MNVMKKLTIMLLVLFALGIGCKKDEAGSNGVVAYTISVNVEDGLSYSLKISGGNEMPYNVIPPSKNASTTVQHSQQKGTTAYVYAETNQYFKGKMIEVIVSKNETGEIIVSDRQVDRVHKGWTVE